MRHALWTLALALLLCNELQAQQSPNFSFTDISGTRHQLFHALDQGYIVMLILFFADCEPCLEAIPEIEQIREDYSGRNLLVWALSDRDGNEALQDYLDSTNISFTLAGPQGMGEGAIDQLKNSLPFFGYPTVSVICPNRGIDWDIWPYSEGAPEWRSAIQSCGLEQNTPPYMPIEPSSNAAPNVTPLSLTVWPNPAGPGTAVELQLPAPVELELELMASDGKPVQQLFAGKLSAGQHSFRPFQNLPPALYLLRCSEPTGTIFRKVLVTN